MRLRERSILLAKVLLVCGGLVPLAGLAHGVWAGTLGSNPIESLLHGCGEWALRFVLLALAVTPLRVVTGWGQLVRLRRIVGLLGFAYAALHVAVYVFLDRAASWAEVVSDLTGRTYIVAGAVAFVVLVPLAATSLDGAVRLLGARRWGALHRSVYVAALAAVVHYWWLVKADLTQPALYAGLLALLLVLRLPKGKAFLCAVHRAVRACMVRTARAFAQT